MKKSIFLASFIFLIFACKVNPLTGKKTFSLVNNNTLFPQAFAAYDQTLSQSKVLPATADASIQVKRVGERIQYAAERFYREVDQAGELAGYEWEFSVIDSDQVNAWCMPGGKIAFYTGILPICKNDAGIATVMGHEVVHALHSHSAEKMSEAMVAQGLLLAGNVAISDDQWRNTFNQFYPMGAQLSMLRYGRKKELDSDEGGIYLMAMAGYDPREAVPFWERMAAQSEGQQRPPEFLSTHPHPESRIAALNSYLPKAMEYYNASPYKGK